MVSVALHSIDNTKYVNDTYLRHVFRLVPNFCLGDTIFWMSLRQFLRFAVFVDVTDVLFLLAGYRSTRWISQATT